MHYGKMGEGESLRSRLTRILDFATARGRRPHNRGIMETAPDKQHAHELIERLPASQISAAVRFLEFMLLDPAARAVTTV